MEKFEAGKTYTGFLGGQYHIAAECVKRTDKTASFKFTTKASSFLGITKLANPESVTKTLRLNDDGTEEFVNAKVGKQYKVRFFASEAR